MLRARLPERCRGAISQAVLITACLTGRGSLAIIIRLQSPVSDHREVTEDEKEAPPHTSAVTAGSSSLRRDMDSLAAS